MKINVLNEVGQTFSFNHTSVQFLVFTPNLPDVVFHQNQISLNKGCSEILQSWHCTCLWFQLVEFLYLCLLVTINSHKYGIVGIFMSYALCKKNFLISEMCFESQLSENDYMPAAFGMKWDEYSILPVTEVALSSELEHFGMLNGAFMGQWLLLVIINHSLCGVRFKPLGSVCTTESSL